MQQKKINIQKQLSNWEINFYVNNTNQGNQLVSQSLTSLCNIFGLSNAFLFVCGGSTYKYWLLTRCCFCIRFPSLPNRAWMLLALIVFPLHHIFALQNYLLEHCSTFNSGCPFWQKHKAMLRIKPGAFSLTCLHCDIIFFFVLLSRVSIEKFPGGAMEKPRQK